MRDAKDLVNYYSYYLDTLLAVGGSSGSNGNTVGGPKSFQNECSKKWKDLGTCRNIKSKLLPQRPGDNPLAVQKTPFQDPTRVKRRHKG